MSYSWSKFRDALIVENKEESVRVGYIFKQVELSGRAKISHHACYGKAIKIEEEEKDSVQITSAGLYSSA
jgi:hypothetical protein